MISCLALAPPVAPVKPMKALDPPTMEESVLVPPKLNAPVKVCPVDSSSSVSEMLVPPE